MSLNFSRNTRVAAALATGLLASFVLSSCAANEAAPEPVSSASNAPALNGTLNAVGASSQASAQEAWIAAFQTAHSGVTINYSPDGSGAGRKAFLAGGVQFAGSDSPLSSEEQASGLAGCAADSAALNLPVYISPIAVIFNVDGVTDLKLDPETIANIFNGTITSWDDPAIAALNAGAKLPKAAITRVNRSDDSGTTKNFSDYLHQNAPAAWPNDPSDTFPYPGGEAAKGTSGVADAVANGSNTIGYADASAAEARGLSTAAIKVGETFVSYSPKAAAAILDVSEIGGNTENDLSIKLNRTSTAAGTYPLVLVSYLITCETYADANVATLVSSYADYLVSEAGQQEAAKAAGAAPLSSKLAEQVRTAIATIS